VNAVVALRAEAAPATGAGHVVRCLALAEALRARGARCLLVGAQLPGALPDWIAAAGLDLLRLPSGIATGSVEDAKATREAIDDLGCGWLVVDGYGFDARWESAVRAPGLRLLAIDDLAGHAHDVDMLVDHNPGRDAGDYRGFVAADARVLAGPAYALLRPEFARARAESLAARQQASLRRVLVAMGGSDPPDATSAALRALAGSPDAQALEVSIVLGSQAPALAQVQALLPALPFATRLLVDSRDMAGELSGCDFAIGAGGGGALERCCLGVPSLTVVLAENQRGGSRALAEAGATLLADSPGALASDVPHALAQFSSPARLRGMSAAAAALVDGQGADRIAAAMLA